MVQCHLYNRTDYPFPYALLLNSLTFANFVFLANLTECSNSMLTSDAYNAKICMDVSNAVYFLPTFAMVQDMFKKAAYLSRGSLDLRPTFQRDAVDDMPIGGTQADSELFNWKDTELTKGNATVGAAFGSMVMPQIKVAKRARKPISLTALQVRLLDEP